MHVTFEVQHAARGSGPRSARRPALSCGVKQLHVAVPSRYRQAVRRPPAHCRAARGGRENPAVPTKPCSGRPQPAEVRNRRRSSRGAPSPDSQSQRRGAGCPPRLSGQSVARMGDFHRCGLRHVKSQRPQSEVDQRDALGASRENVRRTVWARMPSRQSMPGGGGAASPMSARVRPLIWIL
jgi:hypothetical protein